MMPGICYACAARNGGVAPEGHISSCWQGHCTQCRETTDCSSPGDYHWPSREIMRKMFEINIPSETKE